MRNGLQQNALKFGAALTLAALFAACNQTPGPSASVPSSAETDAVAASVSDEVMASASTLTLENGVQSLSFTDGAQSQARRACVTVSPDPVVDSDGDGVPDNATYTFDCSSNRPLFTYTTKGTLQVSDPSSDPSVWGFNSTVNLTNTTTSVLNGKTLTVVRTGTRSPRKTGDAITQSHNITVKRTFTGEETATITNLWNLSFTAAQPGSIQMSAPLSAGTISLSGNYAFSKGSVARTWTLSTTAPLQFDPACGEDLKIVGGTLRATLTTSGSEGFVEVRYGACGVAPVITRSFGSGL